MADKAKETVMEDIQRLKTLIVDAIKSGAYLYPIKGILYFLSHRSLQRPLTSQIAPTITLSIGVTTAMFFFTYVPQAAILSFTSGPFAPISAALLVLSESSTIINALSRSFLITESLTDTFDGTLVSRGCTSLVSDGRQIKPLSVGSDPISKLGKLIKKPLGGFGGVSPTKAIIRSIVYLPLNFIPVVGTVVYFVMQGRRIGPALHERYFQLRGWSKRQGEEWVEKNRGAYTSFGVAAYLFDMIPFASLAFAYTNTVGAALWAANLEEGMKKGE
ncbi:hypothetical protein FQN54_003546 [Arachnomyces sp. PD_36]|nr:hypothetical protein FQN54_003546 [Arachnomyces sp. PD_36]